MRKRKKETFIFLMVFLVVSLLFNTFNIFNIFNAFIALSIISNNIFPVITVEVFAQNNDQNNEAPTLSSETVPRTALAELFVQEGCTTCPTAEFCLEDLAWGEYGSTKLILVEEHLWGDGYDTPETNARYNWYVGEGKKGTPDLFINGLNRRIQGLACECVDENYECYRKAIEEEIVRPALLEISAVKTSYLAPPSLEGKEGKVESSEGERKDVEGFLQDKNEDREDPLQEERDEVVEPLPEGRGEEKGPLPLPPVNKEEAKDFLPEEPGLNLVIEGTIKNISNVPLEDLAVGGMAGREGDEPGFYFYIIDIFPFQNIPSLLPGGTFAFKFTPEISRTLKDDKAEEELNSIHFVILVQNLKTKEVLQSFYIE